jgi:hypothetical protein
MGRTAVLVALAILSAGLLLWRVFSAGKASAQADQTRATLDAVRQKVKSDEAIASLPPDERRRRLAQWVRDRPND